MTWDSFIMCMQHHLMQQMCTYFAPRCVEMFSNCNIKSKQVYQAYTAFNSMTRVEVLLYPLDGMLICSRLPPSLPLNFEPVVILGRGGTVRVKRGTVSGPRTKNHLNSSVQCTNSCPLSKHLLLAKFEGCTVNYGPRFSPWIYGPSAKRTGHKSKGKNKGP